MATACLRSFDVVCLVVSYRFKLLDASVRITPFLITPYVVPKSSLEIKDLRFILSQLAWETQVKMDAG